MKTNDYIKELEEYIKEFEEAAKMNLRVGDAAAKEWLGLAQAYRGEAVMEEYAAIEALIHDRAELVREVERLRKEVLFWHEKANNRCSMLVKIRRILEEDA